MIEVKNLSKHFGTTRAVDGISFEVNRGDILGFLGPNAAGKTTTMRVLTCFITPTTGTAIVGGHDILDNPLEVRKLIGYLPENTPLYNDARVCDFLDFAARIRRIPCSRRRFAIDRVVETTSIQSVFTRPIGQLSKGFRQRVGLAQAMLHDPEILIMDEPTSGLDPKQIIEIRNLIKELGKQKTVILSTHILPEVSATCNRVLIINRGKIAASGTPAELEKKAKDESIFYARIKGPEDVVSAKLREIKHVTDVAIQSRSQSGFCRYAIHTKGDIDVGSEVFCVVRDNNWTLSELHREAVTLEDVFLKLTTDEERPS